MTMHLNTVVATSGFSTEQIKEIYDLVQEGQRLGSKIAKDFTNLSCQEALFHIVAQSTGYEKVASRHPDHYTAYYAIMYSEGDNDNEHEELIEDLHKKVCQAWLDTNSTLFWHVLEFETKFVEFLTEVEALLQVQQNHIWMVVHQTTEDVSASMSNSLVVALHLLNMLPTLLANFTFNTTAPLLTGFVPEVLAHQTWLALNSLHFMHTPPPHSNCIAMDVLKD